MKVSVVMPVYNKADFLREAVESILDGTYKDLELICVDDMSADGSVAVLRSINDPRLRILSLPGNSSSGPRHRASRPRQSWNRRAPYPADDHRSSLQ